MNKARSKTETRQHLWALHFWAVITLGLFSGTVAANIAEQLGAYSSILPAENVASALESQFSVIEFSAADFPTGNQAAVRWAGQLPAWVQSGHIDEAGEFQPNGDAHLIQEAMTLLALDDVSSNQRSWRMIDAYGDVLASQSGSLSTQWRQGFGGPGILRTIWAMTVFQGELVIGGDFGSAGGQTVNHIARWNGTTWRTLGGPSGIGVNGRVNALAVYAGSLFVGGNFTTAGGIVVNRVARWSGSDWFALTGPSGTGITEGFGGPRVEALTIYNGELVVAGSFGSAGGLTANSIARWNGSAWLPFVDQPSGVIGVNGQVSALAVYNGQLVAAGAFVGAGASSASRIARWSGSTWLTLPGPSGNGMAGPVDSVRALYVHNGELVAGGRFSSAGGTAANNIARWTGSTWLPVSGPSGNGVDDFVWTLGSFGTDLLVGGNFSTAGGVSANRIARWDGSLWRSFSASAGVGLNGSAIAFGSYAGQLAVGGFFSSAGGVSISNIATWSGSAWSPMLSAGATGNGAAGSIVSLQEFNGDLVAGGFFSSIGGIAANRIARWSGSAWRPMNGPLDNGVNGGVWTTAIYNGSLVVGGSFTSAGGVVVNRIALWNGVTWSAFPGTPEIGMSGTVRALAVYNGQLVAAGSFSTAGGVTVNNVARWSGTSWLPLSGPSGSGVNGDVNAMAVYNGELVAAGSFTLAGGIVADRIARWNGSNWAPLSGTSGAGVSGPALTLFVHDSQLVVGGQFASAGGLTANNIARWSGSSWSAFSTSGGVGVNAAVRALGSHSGGLIVGGGFTTAGGIAANRLVRWTGSGWMPFEGPLGVGLNSDVYAVSDFVGDLFAAGDFDLAGGLASASIAAYGPDQPASVTLTLPTVALPRCSSVFSKFAYSWLSTGTGSGGVCQAECPDQSCRDVTTWAGSSTSALLPATGNGLDRYLRPAPSPASGSVQLQMRCLTQTGASVTGLATLSFRPGTGAECGITPPPPVSVAAAAQPDGSTQLTGTVSNPGGVLLFAAISQQGQYGDAEAAMSGNTLVVNYRPGPSRSLSKGPVTETIRVLVGDGATAQERQYSFQVLLPSIFGNGFE
jgi:hypothetical protein